MVAKLGHVRLLALGAVIVVAIVAAGLGLKSLAGPTITVRNDLGTAVRIAGCVDAESQDVAPDETFEASGASNHGRIICSVGLTAEDQRCVGIPHPVAAHGVVNLSQAVRIADKHC